METCQSFLPIGFALAVVAAVLRDAEHGTLEGAVTLPTAAVTATRLTVLLGGNALLAVLWLALLVAIWGPAAYGAGLFAALGPALLLCAFGVAAATVVGRATLGYLLVIGWPLGNLVLHLLGWFGTFPVLQRLNVFADRWPVPGVGWPAVAGTQGLAGAVVLALVLAWSRPLLRRLL